MSEMPMRHNLSLTGPLAGGACAPLVLRPVSLVR